MRDRYRKIVPRLWGDERFLALSGAQPNAQTLWLYLLTGPHTTAIPGLFAGGESALSEALGWSLSAFRKAWREIEQAGMARADWRARVVWIPKAVLYNEPESPSVVKAWATQLREIPECELTREAAASLAAYLAACGSAWVAAWTTPSASACASSGAVAVTGTETGTGAGAEASPPTPSHTQGRPRAAQRPTGKRVSDSWRTSA